MTEYQTIVTTRQAKSLCPVTFRRFPALKGGEKMRGKVLISFTPYVHPNKTAEENHRLLVAESATVKAVFPSYNPPSLQAIKALQGARKSMERAVLKAGAIAEKSLPRASEVWFSRIA